MQNKIYNDILPHLKKIETISLTADGDTTVKTITSVINKYSNTDFVKYCVNVINSISKTNEDFCINLFKICCRNVEYRRDPEGHEIIFTPKLLMTVGKGDCKKFATFICAVLKIKGIPTATKVVSYDGIYWQHIYAIVLNSNGEQVLTLDPVNHKQYNKEVAHLKGRINYLDGKTKITKMSKLSVMGNLPSTTNAIDSILDDIEGVAGNRRVFVTQDLQSAEESYINGVTDEFDGLAGTDDEIGKKRAAAKASGKKTPRQQKQEQRKEKRKKIFQGAKKTGFAPARAAFLTLIIAGKLLERTPLKFNLSKRLAQLWQLDGGKQIKQLWATFGGKPEKLREAIIKGSNVQIQGIAGYGYEIAGIGAVAIATVLAAVTAATPITVAVISLLKKNKISTNAEAANAEKASEEIEDKGTTNSGDLKPEVKRELENKPIVKEAVRTDDGGDQAQQREIKQEAVRTKAPSTNDSNTSIVNTNDGQASESTNTNTNSSNANEPNQGSFAIALMNPASFISGGLKLGLIAGMTLNTEGLLMGVICCVSGAMITGGTLYLLKQIFTNKNTHE